VFSGKGEYWNKFLKSSTHSIFNLAFKEDFSKISENLPLRYGLSEKQNLKLIKKGRFFAIGEFLRQLQLSFLLKIFE
jgi:hypothetical protein